MGFFDKFKAENLEQEFLKLIKKKNPAPREKFMLGGLFLASRFYRAAVQTRIWLYDKRVIRNRSIGCLVVSIGNLSCGGTGKTPVVEVFARSISSQGRKVAILSRGYRSKKRTFAEKMAHRFAHKKIELPPRIVSDGNDLLLNAREAGDEPYMLASNLRNVSVIVDKDRVKSGLYAIENFNTDVLILDDGFQYLMLKPHINITLVDSTDPFSNGHVLPRGLLREPVKNIRRADYIFLTKSDGSHKLKHLRTFIRRYNKRAEIIECCHRPQYLEDVFYRGNKLELSELQGAKVASISAIACPASFERFLEERGANIVARTHYADHHAYTEQEILDFINVAKKAGAQYILTTEKDAVRIPKIARMDIPLLFLRIQIDILSGRESFDQCIKRICFL